eukprot:CAMPEP_0179083470 /NCGR_PEP_ID=MMETSP0796-20121207/37695_1 /TAXON_ID=73915 /ORGANISM="Pyrodinium bahamense, Strain pbaha01" /LENGTH=196 /DNA_ID=CAMNT_0020780879 /DNA_START=107 /DNA_END=699 /DNA_ORIENTATION=+
MTGDALAGWAAIRTLGPQHSVRRWRGPPPPPAERPLAGWAALHILAARAGHVAASSTSGICAARAIDSGSGSQLGDIAVAGPPALRPALEAPAPEEEALSTHVSALSLPPQAASRAIGSGSATANAAAPASNGSALGLQRRLTLSRKRPDSASAVVAANAGALATGSILGLQRGYVVRRVPRQTGLLAAPSTHAAG